MLWHCPNVALLYLSTFSTACSTLNSLPRRQFMNHRQPHHRVADSMADVVIPTREDVLIAVLMFCFFSHLCSSYLGAAFTWRNTE